MKQSYFYCYDRKLKNYLVSNKHSNPITYALHPKTKLEFWLFLITAELQKGIAEYKSLGKANII